MYDCRVHIYIQKVYLGMRKKPLSIIFFSFMYRYFEGYTPVLSVSDPDLLKEVLVKDFDNFQSRKVKGRIYFDISSYITFKRKKSLFHED